LGKKKKERREGNEVKKTRKEEMEKTRCALKGNGGPGWEEKTKRHWGTRQGRKGQRKSKGGKKKNKL